MPASSCPMHRWCPESAGFCRTYPQRELVHTDYAEWLLGHWLRILKGDRKAIFTAASAANKAAEYLRGLGGG